MSHQSIPAPGWQKRLVPLVILGALGSLFYLGHRYHWQSPWSHQGPSEGTAAGEKAGPGVAGEILAHPSAEANVVHFGSAVAVQRAGVEIAEVQKVAMQEFVVANGVVNYDQTRVAQLASKVEGTVWRVEKTVGQTVKKGEVLAIVESLDVGKAKAEFLTALSNLDIKTKLLEILNPLNSVVAARQIKEAEAALREAKIRLYNAHQALVNLGLPISVDETLKLSEQQLAARVQFLGLPESTMKTLNPQTTTANLIPLTAPFDGVVIGRDVVVGEVVHPTTAQFTVADLDVMWINLDVRMEDAAKVAVGQEVTFEADGLAQKVRGNVSWISTDVDEKTRTLGVRTDVKNPVIQQGTDRSGPQRLLHAHLFGTGRIRISESPDALAVPIFAVQYDGPDPIVFVLGADWSFALRRVKIGITSADKAEILSGLKPGDKVATVGSHLLRSEILKQRMAAPLSSPSS